MTTQSALPGIIYAAQLCGDFTKAYHPACYEASEREAGYELDRQPARQPKRATFTSAKTTQRVLLTGLDCLPGQEQLFETDGA